MSGNRFYQVPDSAYLFNKIGQPGSLEEPEEAIRQWCAFELMRVYGFKVTDLTFECPVKSGSRNDLRIDIVVRRDGHPWIVVECKRSDYKDHVKAMTQAISYADAQTIKAEFAVYTNGTIWHVKRKVSNDWVEIPDLPTLIRAEAQEHLVDILHALDESMALIYKLDEPMDATESKCFLSVMQIFFNGYNTLTGGVASCLLHATDNLLRVLTANDTKGSYQMEKLSHAGREWEFYRKKVTPDDRAREVDRGNVLRLELVTLSYSLHDLIKDSPSLFSVDVLLLRMNIALLEYGIENEMKRTFLPIGTAIHHTLRAFLDHLLVTRFNTCLPDTLESDMVDRMKGYCEPSWKIAFKNHR